MMNKLQSNIWKLYLIQAITAFLIFVPVLVIYYQHYGLSMSQILILQSVFAVTMVIFQIPTGYFADLMGRKKSIIYGTILAPLTYLIYSFAHTFGSLFIAEIALGIAMSFISGADSALIYDTLGQLKKEKEYKKTEGRYAAAWGISEASASILGGFLAVISINLPFYVETVVALLAIPVAFTLVEPQIHKEEFHRTISTNLKNVFAAVKFSVYDHKEVKWLIFYSAIIWAAIFNMVWFTQAYEKIIGLPLELFGVVWALYLASFSLFSLYAHKYEEKWGKKNSLISLILLTCAGYFLVAYFRSIWGIAFIFLFYFVRGVNVPIFKDYINKLVPSDIRATVLSVQSMASRLLFAIIGPFAGWLADAYSFQTALIISGLIFLVLGLVSLTFLQINNALSISNGKIE
jgi:MFS family permease